MMGMKAFKLNDSIERKELSLGNYSQELNDIVKRYLCVFQHLIQQGSDLLLNHSKFETINKKSKLNVSFKYILSMCVV